MPHRNQSQFRGVIRWGPAVAVAVLVLVTAPSSMAQERSTPPNHRLELPRSHLHRPFEEPIILSGFLSAGGGLNSGWSQGEVGYGGAIIFRPGSAVNFLDFLYDWNAGAVIQVDHQSLGENDEVLAIDGIIRRYFGDRGQGSTEVVPFLGLGLGAARFTVPNTDGVVTDKYFCAVAELGQEWWHDHRWFFLAKAQFRYHLHRDLNYRVWSLQVGAGIPFPE